MLRLLGCSPDTYEDETDDGTVLPTTTAVSRTTYDVSLADLIAAGRLRPGEKLTSTQRSAPGTATLQANGDMQHDGVTYTSPSSAGSAVRNGKATNGWRFWAVERDGSSVPLATVRARHLRDVT